jgi:hypothetical protein
VKFGIATNNRSATNLQLEVFECKSSVTARQVAQQLNVQYPIVILMDVDGNILLWLDRRPGPKLREFKRLKRKHPEKETHELWAAVGVTADSGDHPLWTNFMPNLRSVIMRRPPVGA